MPLMKLNAWLNLCRQEDLPVLAQDFPGRVSHKEVLAKNEVRKKLTLKTALVLSAVSCETMHVPQKYAFPLLCLFEIAMG